MEMIGKHFKAMCLIVSVINSPEVFYQRQHFRFFILSMSTEIIKEYL